jgi:4-amino-4-deoxy-L-arabinose transferase-like glycosyltransferase
VRDLALIGTLALLLRAAWVLVYGRLTTGPNDTLFYEIASSGLAAGRGFSTLFGEPTAHWPPGFPFLVSLAYRALGTHVELGLVLNVLLGTASALLVYLVADRMLGRTAARTAGVIFAILPGPIFLTGLFLAETTYIFMLVGFLALVVYLPDRGWKPLALGVAAGVAALTKGEGMLLLSIPLAAWWGHVPQRTWLRRAALLILAMALTIMPWTVRNAIRMDAFVPVATNASTTLWSGHNKSADGGPTYAPKELLDRIPGKVSEDAAHEVAEAKLLRREAIEWALANPDKEIALIPRKLVSLNNRTSNMFRLWFNAGEEIQVGRPARLVFGGLADAVQYLLLLATLASLAIVGARRLWRLHPGMQGVLAYLALCLVAYGFVYYGQFRYRIPMEPLMILVATPLLARVWARRGFGRGPQQPVT